MLENVNEGLNARSEMYLSKEYFCKMYPTCVSSRLCEFIQFWLCKFIFVTIIIIFILTKVNVSINIIALGSFDPIQVNAKNLISSIHV